MNRSRRCTRDGILSTPVLRSALALRTAASVERTRAPAALNWFRVSSPVWASTTPFATNPAIRFDSDGEEGSVTLITGTLDHGQGHRTSLAQVLAPKLGIAPEKFRLLQGDSDQVSFGAGTGGSRSIMMSGGALSQAAD